MQLSNLHLGSYVLLAFAIVLIVAAVYLKSLVDRLIAPAYRKIPLFSEAEKRFCRALEDALRNEKVKVLAKVRLADLFSVQSRDPRFNKRDFSKISQKHVDFLLVDTVSLEPLMGVELDDSSHFSLKSRDRDKFVDSVFKAAALPLHHIRASGRYDTRVIWQTLFGTTQNISAAKDTGTTEAGI